MPSAVVRRQDYRPFSYAVEGVALSFRIAEDHTQVISRVRYRRQPDAGEAPLRLAGRGFELCEIRLDEAPLDASTYRRDDESLTILNPPAAFSLLVKTRLDPDANSALEGLYRSGPMLCTQCEAHGFSRITYYPDRPDVLAPFQVRIEAPQARYPVLLANGNRVGQGALDGGYHYAEWDDPYAKPCYLFAFVAGDLACVRERYTTASGREIALEFYVDHGNEPRVPHAIHSLKQAMRWDEQTYGLEYDLDTYMVVAARAFNMGAMENKGLNIFNAAYVLASTETATDADFEAITAVIGHEYFHNWTGNRVTCRDWFQLSLKEGLTVFREQRFTEALGSPGLRRIEQVRTLRSQQFPEDAGPTAHPVRPEQYTEINNFYTATVYEKGAEIIRMLETVQGGERFAAGLRRYLRQHDGTAATIEDFLAAQQAEANRDLSGFLRWYVQAGTPQISAADHYESGRYELRLRQSIPGQAPSPPLPIPLRLALLDSEGARIPLPEIPQRVGDDLILFEADELILCWDNLPDKPTPAFLHGYSAPVQLEFAYSAVQLQQILVCETDAFLRWECVQRLMLSACSEWLTDERAETLPFLLEALQRLCANPPDDKALLAELLRLPDLNWLAEQNAPFDPQRVLAARERLRRELASALCGPLSVWAQWGAEQSGADARGRRALSGVALHYLAALGTPPVLELARKRATGSANMTLVLGALAALNDTDGAARATALGAYYQRWRSDPLVLDKWFTLEASAAQCELSRLQELLAHPDFDAANPNRVRAVLGSFMTRNWRHFHTEAGYRVCAARIAEIDRRNPQLAARMVKPLLGWRRLAAPYAGHMQSVLQELATGTLSKDLREQVEAANS